MCCVMRGHAPQMGRTLCVGSCMYDCGDMKFMVFLTIQRRLVMYRGTCTSPRLWVLRGSTNSQSVSLSRFSSSDGFAVRDPSSEDLSYLCVTTSRTFTRQIIARISGVIGEMNAAAQ